MTANYTSLPDFVERKGSLFMRSDHMNYSRATLNSNWHQAREAEPKDYDINRDPTRDLCKATYSRIGNVTDGSLPETTYSEFSQQVYRKKDFTEQETRKPMVNESTASQVDLDRNTGSPKEGYGAVLPTHHAEYDKCHFNTTQLSDFKPPYPYTPAEEKPQEFPDYSMALKKCHSQFTDTADYRRPGRNTWQDESGIYSNSHFKTQTPFIHQSDPITAPFKDQ